MIHMEMQILTGNCVYLIGIELFYSSSRGSFILTQKPNRFNFKWYTNAFVSVNVSQIVVIGLNTRWASLFLGWTGVRGFKAPPPLVATHSEAAPSGGGAGKPMFGASKSCLRLGTCWRRRGFEATNTFSANRGTSRKGQTGSLCSSLMPVTIVSYWSVVGSIPNVVFFSSLLL